MAGEAHAAADSAVGEADAQVANLDAELAAEEKLFESERSQLEAEVHALLARRWQLEKLWERRQAETGDPSSPPKGPPSPTGKAQRGQAVLKTIPPVTLAPGQPEPPPIDAELMALRELEAQKGEGLTEQHMRERRAHATRLWCEVQLADIQRVLAAAAAKKAAAKPKK